MAVKFDLSAITRAAEQAARRARTASTMQQRLSTFLMRRIPPEAKRDILTQYNLKSSRVSQDLDASQTSDGVIITGYARGINLVEFGAKQTSGGLVATVDKTKGARVIPHGFLARAASGKVLAFVRSFIGGRRSPRLPISGLFGQSVAQMLRAPGREDRLGKFAQVGAALEAARLLEIEK